MQLFIMHFSFSTYSPGLALLIVKFWKAISSFFFCLSEGFSVSLTTSKGKLLVVASSRNWCVYLLSKLSAAHPSFCQVFAKLPVLWWAYWTIFSGCFWSPCRSGVASKWSKKERKKKNHLIKTVFLLPQLPCSSSLVGLETPLCCDLWFVVLQCVISGVLKPVP